MAEIIQSHGCQAVLDIGCGDGRLLEHLLLQVKQHGQKYVTLDLISHAYMWQLTIAHTLQGTKAESHKQ